MSEPDIRWKQRLQNFRVMNRLALSGLADLIEHIRRIGIDFYCRPIDPLLKGKG